MLRSPSGLKPASGRDGRPSTDCCEDFLYVFKGGGSAAAGARCGRPQAAVLADAPTSDRPRGRVSEPRVLVGLGQIAHRPALPLLADPPPVAPGRPSRESPDAAPPSLLLPRSSSAATFDALFAELPLIVSSSSAGHVLPTDPGAGHGVGEPARSSSIALAVLSGTTVARHSSVTARTVEATRSARTRSASADA